MSQPAKPTKEEVEVALRADDYHWEYDQDHVNVETLEDPPGSRPPIINIRRRIVGPWEYVNGD